ncbi:MAG: hypothetical protein FWC20_10520, partial [Oscillospiraceae bacterium]|nr:hypothetical protein [Oscillospiraceae bacterium]
LHMILVIRNSGRLIIAPTISQVIKQLKSSVTKQLGFSLWQRSYHDHIIRNHNDYIRIAEYIESNPARWTEDMYYIKH